MLCAPVKLGRHPDFSAWSCASASMRLKPPMTKTLAFVLLVFVTFIGCVTKSETAKDAKSTPSLLETTLIARERQVWEAYKHKDAAAVRDLVSDDSYSVEDADGGVITKAQALQNLPDLAIDDYTMENIRVIPINSSAAVVRYRVKVQGSSHGEPFTPHWSTVSSVWVKRKGKWQNFLYQETQIQHHH